MNFYRVQGKQYDATVQANSFKEAAQVGFDCADEAGLSLKKLEVTLLCPPESGSGVCYETVMSKTIKRK